MRYINLEELLRKRNRWGNSAELWKNRTLKSDFREYFFDKCWYSETPFMGQDVNIDHFRPKAEVEQYKNYRYNEPIKNVGYHWLKNSPENYRASCVVSNRVTGGGGKGNYFPLKENSPYLTEGGCEDEQTMLIDPCVQEDVNKITFMGNKVLAASNDAEDKERVKVTEKIYNLSSPSIKPYRAKVWEDVAKILKELEANPTNEAYFLQKLQDAVSKNAPFSACAIACVNSLAPDYIKEKLDLTL